MKLYTKSNYYEEIANQVIDIRPELRFIKDLGVRVGYLESDQKKIANKKIVHADCEKVNDKNKTYIPYDFIITVYTPNVAEMSENQLKVLMWHELLHIGAEETNDGLRTWINPHDLEDFYLLTKELGVAWAEPMQEIPDILGGE